MQTDIKREKQIKEFKIEIEYLKNIIKEGLDENEIEYLQQEIEDLKKNISMLEYCLY